jgi:hypothetical protein
MKIPERKISETLLEFGDPLLSQLEDPTVEEFRVALTIVIVVWNVHGLSKTTGESRSAYVEELARVRQRLFDEGAPAIFLAAINALEARRDSDYGDDPRCVGEWALLPDGAAGYKFRCDARLPGGSGSG